MLPAALVPDASDRATALAAARHWQLDERSLEHVRTGASFVYRARRAGEPCYLRLTHPGWQSRAALEAELAFAAAARRHGVTAPLAIASETGAPVAEVVGPHGPMLAVLLAAVPGTPLPGERWTTAHARALGLMLARLHNAAADGDVAPGARRDWRDECAVIRAWLPAHEREAIALLDACEAELATWPTSPATFGLAHYDVGGSNVLWAAPPPAEPGVIDFDDCCFHWFATDIAHALWPLRTHALADELAHACLDAYRSRRRLDDEWVTRIPMLGRLRTLGALAWFQFSGWARMSAEEAAALEVELRRAIASPPEPA